MENKTDILSAWREYQSLPDNEWRKDFFYLKTGGFVAIIRMGVAVELLVHRAAIKLLRGDIVWIKR